MGTATGWHSHQPTVGQINSFFYSHGGGIIDYRAGYDYLVNLSSSKLDLYKKWFDKPLQVCQINRAVVMFDSEPFVSGSENHF